MTPHVYSINCLRAIIVGLITMFVNEFRQLISTLVNHWLNGIALYISSNRMRGNSVCGFRIAHFQSVFTVPRNFNKMSYHPLEASEHAV